MLGVAGTGVAVADALSAHTGWFGSPRFSEEDGSEFINTGAPDFPAVAAKLAPARLPLPRGVTLADATSQVVRQSAANPGLMQVTGVKATFFVFAQCQWKRAWLDGQTDPLTAADALERLANNPVLLAVDDISVRRHQAQMLTDARRGDLTSLRADYAANCGGGLGTAPRSAG